LEFSKGLKSVTISGMKKQPEATPVKFPNNLAKIAVKKRVFWIFSG